IESAFSCTWICIHPSPASSCQATVGTCSVLSESTKSTRKQLEIKAESEHRSSKRRSNFTGAEVEVLLQNVDVSILFHYGYILAIEFSAYLFIHLHLQCSCTAFIYFRTSRCLVES